ncbi:MAG TPA: hypothetical protein VNI78_11020 [Vicinamibacterales bacterium]|nr:hypothetical protein [Vicinamibacterales bacterium]
MLYWRTDVLDRPPRSLSELHAAASRARREGTTRYELVWPGARYEGLVTVFRMARLPSTASTPTSGRISIGGIDMTGVPPQARAELLRLHRRLAITAVYVTHDQEEAMTLGERVAVMRDGAIEQMAPPLELYLKPSNLFVARFIGAPPVNLVPAASAHVDAPPGALAGIRPQDVRIGSGGLHALVELVEPRGHHHWCTCDSRRRNRARRTTAPFPR